MSERRRRGLLALSIAGVRLTGRGWGFIGAGLVAMIAAYAGGRPELLYAGALLTVLPVVALVVVRLRRPRLDIVRTFAPAVVQAGSVTSVRVHAHNVRTVGSPRVLWWDRLPWRPFATPVADLPALESRTSPFGHRTSAELHYELTPPRRGVFPIGPFGVHIGDGFGLATSDLEFGSSQELVVTPQVVPLPESWLSVPAGSGEARLVQRRAAGDEDDVMTREYRSGDAKRRVHWRATARHGELMVRQEEQRSLPRARILVDTVRVGYRDSIDDLDDSESEAFEWVVRMLASVTVHLRRSGFAVTIDETGDAQLAAHLTRRRTWGDEEFLSELAALGLQDHAHEPRVEARQDGPLIALLGTPDRETVDWLVRQRRSGSMAVAFMVRNVSSVEMIDRSFGVHTAASAIGERLVDEGWLVVPVAADDDHAAAWEAVVLETGRSRGSA